LLPDKSLTVTYESKTGVFLTLAFIDLSQRSGKPMLEKIPNCFQANVTVKTDV